MTDDVVDDLNSEEQQAEQDFADLVTEQEEQTDEGAETEASDSSLSGKTLEEDTKDAVDAPVEDTARTQGWVPKDEFKGDPDHWRPAQEYVNRAPLLDQISNQNRQIREMRKATDALTTVVKKQADMLTQTRGEEILAKKRSAIEEGNVAETEALEKQYNEIQQDSAEINNIGKKQEPEQEAVAFASRNKEWFNHGTGENSAMYDEALSIEGRFVREHPGWTTAQRLEQTEKYIKTKYPHRFVNQNRSRPASVASSTQTRRATSSKKGYADLPVEAKRVVNRMLKVDRSGKMTRDEYAQQLFLTGAV